jgi:spermidine synthase
MRRESDPRERNIAILGCFFLSGVAGLVYQVAWAKALGLIFGHTVYAAAVVLAVFMAGLASGSVYLSRWAKGHTNPVALYARIEFLIAVTGGLSLAGLAGVRSLYVIVYPVVSGSQIPLLALRLFGVTTVLFIPTLLMGATLPILVHSFVRSSADLGAGVSQLYWVNTLGAVAGTLIAGFVLLPTWGIRVTICCAAAVNALAGLIALWISNGNRAALAVKVLPRKVNPDRNTPQETSFNFLLFLFAVVGSTAFAYEIAWARLLGITIGSSTYAFTLMLAAFLLGTVMGSAFFHRFFGGSQKISIATLSRTQIGIGMAALSSLVLFPWMAAMVPELLRKADQAFGGLVLTQFVVSALAMLPTAVVFGFNFPMVVVLLEQVDAGQTVRSVTVGKAYAANTIGCIVGAVVTGFWLVPWLGSFRVIGVAAAINLLLAVALDWRAPRRHVQHLTIDICSFIVAVVVGFSSLFYNQPLLMLSAVLYGNSHQRRLTFGEVVATTDLVFAEDGVNDSIAVVRTDANVSLRVNGKVDASTGDARTQLLLGAFGRRTSRYAQASSHRRLRERNDRVGSGPIPRCRGD